MEQNKKMTSKCDETSLSCRSISFSPSACIISGLASFTHYYDKILSPKSYLKIATQRDIMITTDHVNERDLNN